MTLLTSLVGLQEVPPGFPHDAPTRPRIGASFCLGKAGVYSTPDDTVR